MSGVLRAGFRIGALAVLALLFALAIGFATAMAIRTPDPNGTVWLGVAAFLALFPTAPAAFRIWGVP